MKLVMAIINDEDAHHLMRVLVDKDFGVTKLSSTGGFLKVGNTTLIIGVEKAKVDEVIEIIKETCRTRNEVISSSPMVGENSFVTLPMEINIGGARVFILDVEANFKF